ncbi:PREDICTED: LOW QUALITY PROTEIN: uncharacterized protein LOC108497407 [Lepidothrix coronata]|uniref:LOW QUALITY PROTEIN: uncharacterized protein LOC108497407 n=1 Tax=Lepidothrix coronata TaxID=321398 RepID=A0A6J0H9Z2_9PASS|nr:PREDICTED: LOW QUALITY PROTEIN: uncharacterized protein LOC108497407 [Lepidothrix coronata]
METQLSRYCKQEDMFNGSKLSGSCNNQSQPKIFTLGTGSSDSSSALTVENLKRLEEEYAASEEAFKMQRVQDYIEQTDLALFDKETSRRTNRDFVCDVEPEGVSLSPPAKQEKITTEVPERSPKKGKILTAPATYSPPAQPTGPVPKESKLLFRLGRKRRSDSPATVNQYNTTLHTIDTAAATQIYTSWRRSSLLYCSSFFPEKQVHCHSSEPRRQCYPDGQMFLLLFQDGSGQVYYTLGNIAVFITFTKEGLFTYCMENSRYPGLRTASGSHGEIGLVFPSHSNPVCFNVGSLLKLKDPEKSHLLKWPESKDELILQYKKIQLRSLPSKNQTMLQYFWQSLSH